MLKGYLDPLSVLPGPCRRRRPQRLRPRLPPAAVGAGLRASRLAGARADPPAAATAATAVACTGRRAVCRRRCRGRIVPAPTGSNLTVVGPRRSVRRQAAASADRSPFLVPRLRLAPPLAADSRLGPAARTAARWQRRDGGRGASQPRCRPAAHARRVSGAGAVSIGSRSGGRPDVGSTPPLRRSFAASRFWALAQIAVPALHAAASRARRGSRANDGLGDPITVLCGSADPGCSRWPRRRRLAAQRALAQPLV